MRSGREAKFSRLSFHERLRGCRVELPASLPASPLAALLMARKEDELDSGGVGQPVWPWCSEFLVRNGKRGGDPLGGDFDGPSVNASLGLGAISWDGRSPAGFLSCGSGSFSSSADAGMAEEFAVLLLLERREPRT